MNGCPDPIFSILLRYGDGLLYENILKPSPHIPANTEKKKKNSCPFFFPGGKRSFLDVRHRAEARALIRFAQNLLVFKIIQFCTFLIP